MSGWVYAFATPSMPGVLKIGATRRDPSERLAEANAGDTWRPPRPYVVVCAVEVADPFACERAVHALLAARRLNTRSEFFEITAVEARSLLALLVPLAVPADETPATDETQAMAPAMAPAPVVAAAFTGFRREAPSTRACRCGRGTVPLTEGLAPEGKLRAWVEEHYVHVPLRMKDTGIKLETLYVAYTTCVPPIHQRILGKILFGKMLNAVYPNIGPHRTSTGAAEVYLLRSRHLAH